MDEETMAYIHKLEQENQYREHKIEVYTSYIYIYISYLANKYRNEIIQS